MESGVSALNRETWNEISQCQTFDLVRRAYHRKHDRKLNAQRNWEIISCFIQAQAYFESATAASETVRPLLLYSHGLHEPRGHSLLEEGHERGIAQAIARA
jgi:hypothetical protein